MRDNRPSQDPPPQQYRPPQRTLADHFEPRTLALACVLLAGILALSVRFFLFPHVSGDMQVFLLPWLHTIREWGGFKALAEAFSNYNPPYLYLLTLVAFLPDSLPDSFVIKLPSVLCDLFAAFLMVRVVSLRYRSPLIHALAFLLVLFTPTVVLNGSMWGQCDVIYASLLLGAVYFLCKERGAYAAICFGLALSVKLQALFLAPLLLIALLRRSTRLRELALIPLVYVVVLIPAALFGRPIGDLFTIYLQQADYYRSLAPNAPTLYVWFSDGDVFRQIPDSMYDLLVPFGIALGLSVALMWSGIAALTKRPITPQVWVLLSYLFTLGMPFVLPKMHDRYFFPADLFSIAVGFMIPRLFWVPLVQQLISLSVYTNVLGYHQILETKSAALLAAALLVFTMKETACALYASNEATVRQQERHAASSRGWSLISWPQAAYGIAMSGLLLIFSEWAVRKVDIDRASLALPIKTVPSIGGTPEASELLPDRVVWNWRPSRGGRSLFDEPIVCEGRTYTNAFAVHANGRLIYDLPPNAHELRVNVGIPDYMGAGSPTTAVFAVYGDGKLLWQSPQMRPGARAIEARVPVVGVQRLSLAISDAGDGDYGDHGLWLEPELSLQ